MKRTCDRCKALKEAQGEPFSCYLGYKMDGDKGIPLEECPKPKTYLDFIDCREWRNKSCLKW